MKKFDVNAIKIPDLLSKNAEMEEKVLDPSLRKILQELPDLELDIVRVKEVKMGEKNKSKLCEDMNIESNAIAPFNSEEAIQFFIDNDLQKHCTYYEPRVIQKLYYLISSPKIIESQELLFWLTYLIKFEPDKRLETINDLRRTVGFLYSKMFSEIDENQETKEEILTLLQFVYGYQIHAYHYKLFPNDRKLFSIRFVQDCYHIVIYVMTGVLVTDYFIHDFLDKLFKDNFFQYQTDSGQLKLELNAQEDSIFYTKMGISKEDFEDVKKFSSLTHEDYADSQKLLGDISSRFSKLGKLEHSKTGLIFNRLQSEMISGLRDISLKEECNDILIDRAKKKQLFQTKSQDSSQMMMSTMNPNSSIMNSDQNFNFSQSKIQKNSQAQQISLAQQSSMAEGSKDQAKISTVLPSVNKKFKFDCAQISPGMQILLSKGIANVNNKKKIGFSSYQIPNYNQQELSKYYNILTSNSHRKQKSANKTPFSSSKKDKKFASSKKFKFNRNVPVYTQSGQVKQILRLAQAKFEDNQRYNHLDVLKESGNMKSKFSEFYGIKCVIDEMGEIKYPANERFELVQKKIPKFPDHYEKAKYWEEFFNQREEDLVKAEEEKEHQTRKNFEDKQRMNRAVGEVIETNLPKKRIEQDSNEINQNSFSANFMPSLPREKSHLGQSPDISRLSQNFNTTLGGHAKTERNLDSKANKTGNFGPFNIKQKVIEKKYFKIEEDDDDKFRHLKKISKGKKHKIDDRGVLAYFDNKKYYTSRYGAALTNRQKDVGGVKIRDFTEPSIIDRQTYGGKKGIDCQPNPTRKLPPSSKV